MDLELDLRLQGQKRIANYREEVTKDNLKKDVLIERIKQECWRNSLETGKHLWPFVQGSEVPNFPDHKKDSSNIRAAHVTKLLRIVEIQENKYTSELKLVVTQMDTLTGIQTVPGSAHSIASETIPDADLSNRNKGVVAISKEPLAELSVSILDGGQQKMDEIVPSRRSSIIAAHDSVAGKAGDEAETTVSKPVTNESTSSLPTPEEEQEETESPSAELLEKGPIENVLYSAFNLTTPKKKRTQRVLLFKQLQTVREDFNKKFASFIDNKDSIVEKIKEMHARVLELQKKLGVKNDYILPQLDHHEDFESVFTVKDREIPIPNFSLNNNRKGVANDSTDSKWVTQGKNDAERALQDMMGGKLENKKEELIVDTEAERPAWMLGNPKSFTKEQIKEIKEFDARLKAVKEEKEKKQRAQELELRKLKSDIQDLMNNFDASLLDLYYHRLEVEARCLEIEESISRFSMEIEDEEFLDEVKEHELSEKLDQFKSIKGQSVGMITEFKREIDDFKAKYEATVGEDKALDRNFKKEFSDCAEQISLLYRHYRKRKPLVTKIYSKGIPQQSPNSGRQKSVQGRGKVRYSISLGKPLLQTDTFNDRPEEIDPDTWARLISARNRKIGKEEEVRTMTETMTKMNDYMNRLLTQDDHNRKEIENSLRMLAEFREGREKKRKNLALLLHIKQGMVEIEMNPMEGDYVDAALLPRTLIEEFNDVILREANLKVKILTGMKNFKRGIYEVKWDINMFNMLERILIEKIRFIQLLRNTKALQMVIKNGEEMINTTENTALQGRLEHTKMLHDKRIQETCIHLEQLERKLKLIEGRNVKCQQQASELYQQYIFATRVCNSSTGKESNDAALKQKERGIVAKRKLRDIVKAQQVLISEVLEDCTSLRKRSFPILPLGYI